MNIQSTKNRIRPLLAACVLVFISAWQAATAASLADILAMPDEPPGVLIEIVHGSEYGLRELLPDIENARQQLKQRFPDTPLVIVSHGQEQFGLISEKESTLRDVHDSIRDMTDEGVNVHVCGTHASWYDIQPEDYPDYIDVSPSGPAQINDYRALGFIELEL